MPNMLENYSDFEVHYAFSIANALYADYLRRNPNLDAESKAKEFAEFFEGGLSAAKEYSASLNK